jgi:hypothetical protein
MKRSAWVLGLVVAISTLGFAATTSNNATVALSATVASSITISPIGAVTFGAITPTSTTNNATTSSAVTMSWNLAPSHTALKLYAYFASPTQALSDGQPTPSNIPTTAFFLKASGTAAGQTNNIPTFTAVSGSPSCSFCVAGASVLIKTVAIGGANKQITGDTTTLDYNLDLSGVSTLAAGTYSGTLNIQAEATP